MHDLAVESRERYQDLLAIAVTAASKNTAAAELAIGNPSSRIFAAVSRESSMEHEVSPGPHFGEEELHLKGVAKERERVKALIRKQSTLNVHTILHFYDAVVQFTSVLNVVTLQGEDRYRYVCNA
jgi:hypothetical protein